jgi:sigma-B regulation protein RsbU (phosphoserine phosphatase)
MPRFRDLSIRTKLMTGFMLTSLVALLITMAALGVYDRNTIREETLRDARVLAGIIGENASTSIAFNDAERARLTLAALRAQPHILSAWLYDHEGHLFASYNMAAGPPPAAIPRDGSVMTEKDLSVTVPVLFSGTRVGTVVVRSDLGEVVERRERYIEIAAAVAVGASFVALLLAAAFQRVISRPIKDLLAIENRVSREKDYTLHATKVANDEIGQLIDGFNEMLAEIRARDAEIFERHKQEMELARTIQTSVLPRTFNLPGFDISAIMLPAEEVGGDFYEFRNTGDGGAWIGVGDVTGHGVTSGLIMMMAQSMFTILCEQNGHDSPARFLSLLNRAMFYNLRSRLDQDKFMTMVVARIHRDGRLVFAGAHTDLLVYRAGTKSVERIPTEGVWLGISEDIGPDTVDGSVTLERGDVALFHTDGVTEARNRDGELFDLDRLTAKLRELHRESAIDVVSIIAQDAWNWAGVPTDDVSLMAVKRS